LHVALADAGIDEQRADTSAQGCVVHRSSK
jgi:hypothetical protein